MRRRTPVRNRRRVDVPEPGEFLDVLLVVPVAECDQLSVGTALARVLRGRLAVHLEDRRARLSDESADEVQVVDLHCRGCRLHRLVDALEAARHHSRRVAEDRRCFAQERLRNLGDLLDSLGRIRCGNVAQLRESEGVPIDE